MNCIECNKPLYEGVMQFRCCDAFVCGLICSKNRLKKLHAHHGYVSGVAAMLRTSASGGEQPEAENQDRHDSPRLADAAPGNAKWLTP